jgi:hypothetical protein
VRNSNSNKTPTKEAPSQGALVQPLHYVGVPLTAFGIVFAAMLLFFHFRQQPRAPLGFDLSMTVGYGGGIFYGLLAALIGIVLIRLAGRNDQK